MGSVSSIADASVRVARAADADAIAEVQVRSWRTAYAECLPDDVIESLDGDAIAAQWRASLHRPPDARNRALVVLAGEQVVGFAATGPADDPDTHPIADGAIIAFHVDPDATGRGHGSRLLNASIDTLRADGFHRAVTWLFAADDALRTFLTAAGWAADGAHRELEAGDPDSPDDADNPGDPDAPGDAGDPGTRTKQVRLHCSLDDEPGT